MKFFLISYSIFFVLGLTKAKLLKKLPNVNLGDSERKDNKEIENAFSNALTAFDAIHERGFDRGVDNIIKNILHNEVGLKGENPDSPVGFRSSVEGRKTNKGIQNVFSNALTGGINVNDRDFDKEFDNILKNILPKNDGLKGINPASPIGFRSSVDDVYRVPFNDESGFLDVPAGSNSETKFNKEIENAFSNALTGGINMNERDFDRGFDNIIKNILPKNVGLKDVNPHSPVGFRSSVEDTSKETNLNTESENAFSNALTAVDNISERDFDRQLGNIITKFLITEKGVNPESPVGFRSSEGDDKCVGESDRGSCLNFVTNYFYDARAGDCKRFVYGGCGGNKNRFSTLKECRKQCGGRHVSNDKQSEDPYEFLDNYRSGSLDVPAGKEPFQELLKFVSGNFIPQEVGVTGNFIPGFRSSDSADSEETPACKNEHQGEDCQSLPFHYYYDSNRHQCKFSSRLKVCGGNGNTFESYRECEKKCGLNTKPSGPPPKEPFCLLDVQFGLCKALLPRFHYDDKSGSCVPFEYSGCVGNANNFHSKTDCEEMCIANKESPEEENSSEEEDDDDDVNSNEISPCRAEQRGKQCYRLRNHYYYDSQREQCKFSFNSKYCGGKENLFKTYKECERKCGFNTKPKGKPPKEPFCLLDVQKGSCKSRLPRFYYDDKSGSCKQFMYSGCRGNANSFQSRKHCEKICIGKRKSKGHKHESVKKKTSALAALPEGHKHESFKEKTKASSCVVQRYHEGCFRIPPHYYYDTKRGHCLFVVTPSLKCGGLRNRFNTFMECQKKCGFNSKPPRSQARICRLLPKAGRCKGSIVRFYYDDFSQKCKTFLYSGCKGNANNFHTLEDCKSICQGRNTIREYRDDEYHEELVEAIKRLNHEKAQSYLAKLRERTRFAVPGEPPKVIRPITRHAQPPGRRKRNKFKTATGKAYIDFLKEIPNTAFTDEVKLPRYRVIPRSGISDLKIDIPSLRKTNKTSNQSRPVALRNPVELPHTMTLRNPIELPHTMTLSRQPPPKQYRIVPFVVIPAIVGAFSLLGGKSMPLDRSIPSDYRIIPYGGRHQSRPNELPHTMTLSRQPIPSDYRIIPYGGRPLRNPVGKAMNIAKAPEDSYYRVPLYPSFYPSDPFRFGKFAMRY